MNIEYLIWDCNSKNWLVYDTRSFQLLSTLPQDKNNLLPTQAFLSSATFNYLCVASRIVRLFQLNKAKHLWKWNLMLTFKLSRQICVSVDYLIESIRSSKLGFNHSDWEASRSATVKQLHLWLKFVKLCWRSL